MCHNPRCCNPAHLRIGTHKDNYYDSIQVHKRNTRKRMRPVTVNGRLYESIRKVVNVCRVGYNSIAVHVHDGIFDVVSYNIGCLKGNRRSRIPIKEFVKTDYPFVFKNPVNGTYYYWVETKGKTLARSGFRNPIEATVSLCSEIKRRKLEGDIKHRLTGNAMREFLMFERLMKLSGTEQERLDRFHRSWLCWHYAD